MQRLYRLENHRITDAPCALTFGAFDGVHRGHQYIFEQLFREAKQRNLKRALITFSNHPQKVLRPDSSFCELTPGKEKEALLAAFGFDIVISVPFDETMRQMSREAFLEAIQSMLPLSLIVVGRDVAFGKDRQGSQAFLEQPGHDFEVMLLDRYAIDGIAVSSSRCRQAIFDADFALASKLLGRPYSVYGTSGNGKCLPPAGKYLVRARLEGESGWSRGQVRLLPGGQIEPIDLSKPIVELRFLLREE